MQQPALLRDRPVSEGMANVLRRAAQFALVRWTPLSPVPMTANIQLKRNDREPFAAFPAWRPQTGLPYSSVRLEEKFIGYNVSLETFFTALANPKSVLYTRDLTGRGLRMSCWYGIVCSAFVSFALDLPYRRPCTEWGKYGDMIPADVHDSQGMMLCDVLCSANHAALVTGVTRSADGSVHSIEVTESTRPLIVTTEFSPEEFDGYWMKEFRVFRYAGIDGVRYTPSPYVPLAGDPALARPAPNPTLLPDYGNRANYRLGEPVEFNVMQDGWTRLVVEDQSGTAFEQRLERAGTAVFLPQHCGFYRAFCAKGGSCSEPVEFAVVHFEICCEEEPAPGRPLRLAFALPTADRPVCCTAANASDGFTAAGAPIPEAAAQLHHFEFPPLLAGTYRLRALARNEYGLYPSEPLFLTIPKGGRRDDAGL